MTDRHPSLISGVKDVFGSQCHSWCLRHLMENFTRFMKLHGKSKDTAKELLNKIAYARTTEAYEKALQKMAHFRMELHDWVLDNGPEHWANALFPLQCWDIMYTNQAESFNAWIKEERLFSIMRLMDGHLTKLTEFLYRKKMEIGRWSKPVGPNVEDKLKGKQIASHGFSCMPCGPTKCVVYDLKKRGFKVLLGKESFCSCMEWTMTGIPCAHACCAIETYSLNIYEMVDPNLCFEKQQAIYEEIMSHVPTHDMPLLNEIDSIMHLRPPSTKRPLGRPHTKRIESQFQDQNITVHCSRCNEPGHNRRKCKAPLSG